MSTRMKRSEQTQKRLEQGRAAARQRTIERGIVAFRADEEMMESLLHVAESKRIPYGVLARSWVAERLQKEMKE